MGREQTKQCAVFIFPPERKGGGGKTADGGSSIGRPAALAGFMPNGTRLSPFQVGPEMDGVSPQ